MQERVLETGEVTMAAAGTWHSLIVNPERTVVAWGGLVPSVTNVPPGLSEVLAISAGYEHCLALRSNGTVVATPTPRRRRS